MAIQPGDVSQVVVDPEMLEALVRDGFCAMTRLHFHHDFQADEGLAYTEMITARLDRILS